MKLLICIDDTDNLDSKGTGAIAEELRAMAEERFGGRCGPITRHQLLLHEDIPYTSHNSSMCFDCVVEEDCRDGLAAAFLAYLTTESAPGSDPGLAIAIAGAGREALLRFGMDAKRVVLRKEQAYDLARRTGVYLAEAGGTGGGVIGALAGIGLRMGGNDGEIKGKMKQFQQGETYSVALLTADGPIVAVCDMDLRPLEGGEQVYIAWKAKPLLAGHQVVLPVRPTGQPGLWSTMVKREMREFGDLRVLSAGCDQHLPDVEEEQVEAPAKSCLNCRYRRWTSNGFLCGKDRPQ